jgi:hypothetical protein
MKKIKAFSHYEEGVWHSPVDMVEDFRIYASIYKNE